MSRFRTLRWQHERVKPSFIIAAAFLFVIVLVAALAPWITPYDPGLLLNPVALASRYPTLAHPFGTDPYSRDILSRIIAGARVSLVMSLAAVFISTILGVAIGFVSGFNIGSVDRILMRAVDVCLSIPRVLLLLTIIGLWGAPSLSVLAVVLGATGWMGTARVVRAEFRALRNHPRILAARAIGLTDFGIILHHLFPETLPLVLVNATFGIGQVLLLESGLSYLGIGVQAPMASWGTVLLDVGDVVGAGRWLVVAPGLVVIGTVVAFHRLGNALQVLLESPQ